MAAVSQTPFSRLFKALAAGGGGEVEAGRPLERRGKSERSTNGPATKAIPAAAATCVDHANASAPLAPTDDSFPFSSRDVGGNEQGRKKTPFLAISSCRHEDEAI